MAPTDVEATDAFHEICSYIGPTTVIHGARYPSHSLGLMQDPWLARVYLEFARQCGEERHVRFLIDARKDCLSRVVSRDRWADPQFSLDARQRTHYYENYFKQGAALRIGVRDGLLAEGAELLAHGWAASNRALGNLFKVCINEVCLVLDGGGSIDTGSVLHRFYFSPAFRTYRGYSRALELIDI